MTEPKVEEKQEENKNFVPLKMYEDAMTEIEKDYNSLLEHI
jgi:hypothetical protein